MKHTQTKTEETPLAETCNVCDRVRWGDFQVLPLLENAESRPWRHRECNAGSSNWLEVQRLRPEKKRSPFYRYYVPNN